MTTGIFWFRNDLRLVDNPALTAACMSCDRLLLLAVVSPAETRMTPWEFPRWSINHRSFRDQALEGLKSAVAAYDSELLTLTGTPAEVIPAVAHDVGADLVICEAIAAPEEIAEIAALRESNLEIRDQWQSSLLDLAKLPFALDHMPEVFTAFRHSVEKNGLTVPLPIPRPASVPPRPSEAPQSSYAPTPPSSPHPSSSFPFDKAEFHGAERAAIAHLERYFHSTAPQIYKSTRNGLTGTDYSTKFSPWLATGALSPRTVYQYLKQHERQCGANESTYWISFELLWRDFFRFSSLKHGIRLFSAAGLSHKPPPPHDPQAFENWCAGRTGQDLVDAGMRELAATGYLSNRMRQIVASYLINELSCDWRAGAAWFESRLIDYDVCSNQGNWLYLAGRGADPRQGRQFNVDKQAATYDSDGAYRKLWANPVAL